MKPATQSHVRRPAMPQPATVPIFIDAQALVGSAMRFVA